MDKVLEVTTEHCTTPPCLISQTGLFTVSRCHKDTLVGRTILMGSIIDITRLVIHAKDVTHFIVSLFHLTEQLPIEIIEIEMHPSVTLTG